MNGPSFFEMLITELWKIKIPIFFITKLKKVGIIKKKIQKKFECRKFSIVQFVQFTPLFASFFFFFFFLSPFQTWVAKILTIEEKIREDTKSNSESFEFHEYRCLSPSAVLIPLSKHLL